MCHAPTLYLRLPEDLHLRHICRFAVKLDDFNQTWAAKSGRCFNKHPATLPYLGRLHWISKNLLFQTHVFCVFLRIWSTSVETRAKLAHIGRHWSTSFGQRMESARTSIQKQFSSDFAARVQCHLRAPRSMFLFGPVEPHRADGGPQGKRGTGEVNCIR